MTTLMKMDKLLLDAMEAPGCSCKVILDRQPVDVKAAALRVSPSIVSVLTYNVPDDMIINRTFYDKDGTNICPGSGVIFETQVLGNSSYASTIICPGYIFKRTNGVQPHQIEVDVCVSGGTLYKGELLACDFHYNLAAIRILSDTPLRPATLRHVTHSTSLGVRPDQLQHSHSKRPRLSDFNSFQVQSGTKIIIARRYWSDEHEILVSTHVLRTHGRFVPKEMFSMKGSKFQCKGGGAVINYLGEVIGICFNNASFLPVNLVSRWWDHYQSCKEFLRPCLGVKVVNLHEAHTDVLNELVTKFPNNVTGVVVTKVEKTSPAHQFGIKIGDVIIKCDGDLVRSKLELFEKVWDNAGRVVELDVLKASNGDQLNLSLTIEETAPDNLYKWRLPYSCSISAHHEHTSPKVFMAS